MSIIPRSFPLPLPAVSEVKPYSGGGSGRGLTTTQRSYAIVLTFRSAAIAALCLLALMPASARAAGLGQADIETLVGQSIRPQMERYNVPGMAVGIVFAGRTYVYNFGVISKATRRPVTTNTLFEIGSVTKTFTATLASYAQVTGRLSLSDPASKYLPSLRGRSFDNITLLNLATHTTGGLPLQVPDSITNNDQLMQYFQNWKPTYPPGTFRLYSNPGIGLLGMIAANSLHGDFAKLMEDKLFLPLGMTNTYLDVPLAHADDYAQGYTKSDAPIRMTSGVLASEAYGVRSTAGDMIRFIEANLRMLEIDPPLQDAITLTHTRYYRVGPMTQDLVWEQYPSPVELKDLLAGNSANISGEANPAKPLDPPVQPSDDVLINKTGSTNGFAAYAAFVPQRRIGIVLLANKNYSVDARVTAVFEILTRLEGEAGKSGSDQR
jgi:beta-lactamase class C